MKSSYFMRSETAILTTMANEITRETRHIMAAIEALKEEGLLVRLVFVYDMPSIDVRYVQVQADIIVDSFAWAATGRPRGRHAWKARGRFLRSSEASSDAKLRSLAECPIVNASMHFIRDVLRRSLRPRSRETT